MLKQDDAEAGWCWSRMMMQQDPIRGQETLILYLPAAPKVCDHPLPISDIDEQSSKPVTSGDRSAGWPTAPAKVQRRTEAITAPKVRIRPPPISDIDEPSGNRHMRREIIRITTSSSARRKKTGKYSMLHPLPLSDISIDKAQTVTHEVKRSAQRLTPSTSQKENGRCSSTTLW